VETSSCPPAGHLSIADFWIELRGLIKARPRFERIGWPDQVAAGLTELQDRDEDMERLALRKGLRMFAPVRRAEIQEQSPRIEGRMIYSFFDSDGDFIVELAGFSLAFIWLHKQAEAVLLEKHLRELHPPRSGARRL